MILKRQCFGGAVLGAYGFFVVGMAFTWATMNGMLGAGMKAAVDQWCRKEGFNVRKENRVKEEKIDKDKIYWLHNLVIEN